MGRRKSTRKKKTFCASERRMLQGDISEVALFVAPFFLFNTKTLTHTHTQIENPFNMSCVCVDFFFPEKLCTGNLFFLSYYYFLSLYAHIYFFPFFIRLFHLFSPICHIYLFSFSIIVVLLLFIHLHFSALKK